MTAPAPVPDAAERRSLGALTHLGYGSGSVATGAYGTVPGLLLLPFLTDEIGVAAFVAGIVFVAPKLLDVVLDPVAGRISDRKAVRSRRPFLLWGGIGLAIAFGALFAVPDSGGLGFQTVWVVVAFLACAVAFSFFQVPFVAMPAEMTDSYDVRSWLMSWRVMILAVTILVAGGGAPVILDAVGGRDGYRLMGLVIAGLILLGSLAVYFGTRSAPVSRVDVDQGSLRDQLRLVARSGDFRLLLGTFFVQGVAIGLMLASVAYVADDVLDRLAFATVLFGCFVVPSILVTPLWSLLATRIGKRRGYVISSLVLAAGAVPTMIAGQAGALGTVVLLLAVGVVGIGYAGCQVFPLAMLPDAAAVDAHRTGSNRAGVFTGVWTATETLGLALGPGLLAFMLTVGGYQSGAGAEQTDSAEWAIRLAFSLVPAVLILASLMLLRRYRLDAAEVEAALADTKETA